ncbi:UNVERIFIED_CONTAM: hypothetical protein GTU68_045495, partial [Idotea baltica]|nr:hypothetical protein [Idotea baltica]
MKEIREAASILVTHSEVRVRLAAGEVLGSLCAKDNCFTYTQFKPKLLHLIQSNLDRDVKNESGSEGDSLNNDRIMEKLNYESRERRNSGNSSSAAQIFHDTAGWRNLETSMKCLESMIKGCGDKFIPFIDQELLELLFTTLVHTNRFVRETGFTVCAALVSCGVTEGEDPIQGNPMIVYGDQLAKRLAQGLADNWSQVRLAASEASRKFLVTLPIAAREKFFPYLLPRICLNRYYVAEGVRLYSQETWRQITGSEGRTLVQKYIDDVVPYYVEATEADNHAVREAACECIAELALKIPENAVRPHVASLLQGLKVCFNDDSWPVRDAACLACGNFFLCFPEESSQEFDALFPLFFKNLQ